MLDEKYVVQYSIFYYIVRYQLDTKQVGINGLYSLKKVVKLLILNLSTHCDLTHTHIYNMFRDCTVSSWKLMHINRYSTRLCISGSTGKQAQF